MKNLVSIKSVKTESPKTPGGISKSLLTPCRRIGLSRNYKKVGPAPFISPLSSGNSTTVEAKVEKKEPRKRKKSVESEENKEESLSTQSSKDGIVDVDEADTIKSTVGENDLSNTPTRHIEVPRKKKSKTLLSALNKTHTKEDTAQNQTNETKTSDAPCGDKNITVTTGNQLNDIEDIVIPLVKSRSKLKKVILPQDTPKTTKENIQLDVNKQTEAQDNAEKQDTNVQERDIVTPLRKSKGKKKITSPKPSIKPSKEKDHNESVIDLVKENNSKETAEYVIKPRSPNDLTKECIVVLQKKMFKTDKIASKKRAKNNLNPQILDSDSDQIPLGQLNKEKADCHKIGQLDEAQIKEQINTQIQEIITLDDEEDFSEKNKSKVKKLEDKATSIGGLKNKPKISKTMPQKPIKPLQNSEIDDDDDFDFENKRTILIRKTYEKVHKPQKAKSTGSITQADINELKARIEAKKKLLLARAMTEDTEELRSLIKRWQKGCQDALMELMELMKNKFPDKQNMDYSEMLSMLKIPFNLVGYDEEDDCFTTPDDTGNILSKFND